MSRWSASRSRSPLASTQTAAAAVTSNIFDNGEGGTATPDQSSLVGFGDEGANEAFCNGPIFDNGEGGTATPDQSSLVGFGDEGANEAFCNGPNLPRFGPWDVQGNVQVEA